MLDTAIKLTHAKLRRTTVLTFVLKPGERFFIGDNVVVSIGEVRPRRVQLGVEAPRDIRVFREKVLTLAQVEEIERAAREE